MTTHTKPTAAKDAKWPLYTGPVEVWLTQKNMEIRCLVVFEDESTERIGVDSLSLRGAQREITRCLIDQGYQPVGRWGGDVDGETFRIFKRKGTQ